MLLEKKSSVSIHDRNVQVLATKMYTVSKGYLHLLSEIYLNKKIVSIRIYNKILSFQDLLLELFLTELKVYLSRSSNMGYTC